MSTTTHNTPDKLTRLVEYLTALAKINAKNIRTIDKYRKIFWLHSLPPDHQYRFSRMRGRSDNADDVWFEVQQNRRSDAVKKIYTDLFRMYQEQQKLGEQYELVLCFGLLTWKTAGNQNIRRHLIASRVSLTFDADAKKFTVRQAGDADQIPIEFDMLDMLDIEAQPKNVPEPVRDRLEAIDGDLWNRKKIDAAFTSIIHSLAGDGQGEYYPDRLASEQSPATRTPVIEYAPALILRKRSMRSLEQLLSTIKTQIEEKQTTETIPDEFLRLCESLPGKNNEQERETTVPKTTPNEIFFPLPANEAQRRIISSLENQKGVIVQGPPGTGKSHTVANLICHLLADGKRVLVTAKTARALQVLHDKLPENIRPLCINLLGGGNEEQKSLKKSVSGILSADNMQRQADNNEHIRELEERIQTRRNAKKATDKKIFTLRELETRQEVILRGGYSGTAARIAAQLRRDAVAFSWFTDTISQDTPLPCSLQQITLLRKYLLEIDKKTEKILTEKQLPELKKKFPVHKMRKAFEKEEQARKIAALRKDRLQSGQGKILFRTGRIDREIIEALRQHLADFTTSIQALQQRPMPWIDVAIHDVLTDQGVVWSKLLKLSKGSLKAIHELVIGVDALEVAISWEIDRKKLLHDAITLKEHFKSGGGAGKWIFKPEIIRKHGGLISKITVDGQACGTTAALWKLVDYLTVDRQFNYIWHLWEGKAERSTGHFPFQLAEIEELHQALEEVLRLHGKREHLKKIIRQIKELESPNWLKKASPHALLEDCQAVLARLDLLWLSHSIADAQKILSAFAQRGKAHPITKLVVKSLKKRDIATYSQLFAEIIELTRKADKIAAKKQLLEELSCAAPKLAAQLTSCGDRALWAERLRQLDQAWAWAQGTDWLKHFPANDLESHLRHSWRLDREIQADLSQLTAARAWLHFFAGMNAGQHRHLTAWRQAMKKLGKGTGKHAQTHKENARRHLSECRDAIPAWIMPLHRVYETVKAEAGLFDVIIVDEASQCGPEALPLLYLGKRVLVVGDDKQISPEAVGINREHVQQYMRTYLADFDHADSFDVDSSLFDHALLRFSGRITLKEHFRCMPEIIRFSDKLCYQSDPLIPLRQYLPDRLEPLKAIFVDNGCQKGKGQGLINPPEAEALVAAIARCVQDERYQGKSMGVIVLQGTAQSYLLEELLFKAIGAEEMEKRNLICGNSNSFQGGERDIIFLSMVIAANTPFKAMTKAADQRRVNVAASRAKEQMWLFHSVKAEDLGRTCLRRRLLEHFRHPAVQTASMEKTTDIETLCAITPLANRDIEDAPDPFDSWFEVDIALHLASLGYRVIPQYAVADGKIDMVIQGSRAQLAVECDSDHWHGPDQYSADLRQQKKLERCGWHFFRIQASRYYADPDKALEPLQLLLERLEILPVPASDQLVRTS
jgi:very-short-patch-repair endonuclease